MKPTPILWLLLALPVYAQQNPDPKTDKFDSFRFGGNVRLTVTGIPNYMKRSVVRQPLPGEFNYQSTGSQEMVWMATPSAAGQVGFGRWGIRGGAIFNYPFHPNLDGENTIAPERKLLISPYGELEIGLHTHNGVSPTSAVQFGFAQYRLNVEGQYANSGAYRISEDRINTGYVGFRWHWVMVQAGGGKISSHFPGTSYDGPGKTVVMVSLGAFLDFWAGRR